jgi:hypothetical protein
MLGRRTTGGASAERRAEGAAEAGMPFFDLYGKMQDDLLAWEESKLGSKREGKSNDPGSADRRSLFDLSPRAAELTWT